MCFRRHAKEYRVWDIFISKRAAPHKRHLCLFFLLEPNVQAVTSAQHGRIGTVNNCGIGWKYTRLRACRCVEHAHRA